MTKARHSEEERALNQLIPEQRKNMLFMCHPPWSIVSSTLSPVITNLNYGYSVHCRSDVLTLHHQPRLMKPSCTDVFSHLLVRDYKEWRNSVLSLRDEERRHRNMLKHHQVELVEEWQGKLDEDRKVLNKTREAIRAKYEREREAESAEERARQEEAAEKDTKGKRKTTGKKRK